MTVKRFLYFYPSDYEYKINKKEKKNIEKYKKLRRKYWKSYAGVAANSLLFNEDKDLEKLDRIKRQKELEKREKRWKRIAKMYLEGDYIGVIEEAPKLFPYPSHQAAAYFLSGLSNKKMQDYKAAVSSLEKQRSTSLRIINFIMN